jgi:diguanylate cyclase (GGDEF)-like protein/PAS domain S-box-containing protein
LARLVISSLFVGLWAMFWLARVPMPFPFLIALLLEIAFFIVYWRVVFVLPNVQSIAIAQYVMLAAEIVFHTTMVYFLGGLSWLGAFAYVFGLIFTNAFLDLRRGLFYTTGACLAFSSMVILDATGVIPHYTYLAQDSLRYSDSRFVGTTLVCAIGVFFSIYLWSSWVGSQLRRERDAALKAQGELLDARIDLQRANEDLERRVRGRTVELEMANVALRESETRVRTVITNAPIVLFALNRDGMFTLLEGKALEAMSVQPQQVVGRSAFEVYANAPTVTAAIQLALSGERATTLAPGGSLLFEAQLEPLLDDRGNSIGVIGVATDITERKRAEDGLRESEGILRATIESTQDGILVVNNEGKVVYTNKRFGKMWRIPSELLDSRDDDTLLDFVVGQLAEPDAFLSKVRHLYKSVEEDLDTLDFLDGRAFERYSRPLILDDQLAGRVWSFRDVTARKFAERTLAEQARLDPLTGLLNRRAGLAAIDHAITAARRVEGSLAVFVVDLDRFKSINDTYSHETGDSALNRVAEALTEVFASRGVVCRLGGDEFEIAVSDIDITNALDLAAQFQSTLQRSLTTEGRTLPTFTATVGIACFPEDGSAAAELGRYADQAMYAGKALGGDTVRAWRDLKQKRAA